VSAGDPPIPGSPPILQMKLRPDDE
jgi:hypothetical protein